MIQLNRMTAHSAYLIGALPANTLHSNDDSVPARATSATSVLVPSGAIVTTQELAAKRFLCTRNTAYRNEWYLQDVTA